MKARAARRAWRSDPRRGAACRGWRRRRARPEHALLAIDPRRRDPRVVRRRAGRGLAQLLEDGARPRLEKPVARSERAARVAEDPQIGTHALGGGSTTRRRRITRPSRLVIVPSSSAHCAEGRTTSARRAVSDRKKSQTTRKSSAPSRSSMCVACGADTTGFEPITSRPRTPRSRPSVSSSSYAERPGPGRSSGAMPHSDAMCSRADASSSWR